MQNFTLMLYVDICAKIKNSKFYSIILKVDNITSYYVFAGYNTFDYVFVLLLAHFYPVRRSPPLFLSNPWHTGKLSSPQDLHLHLSRV